MGVRISKSHPVFTASLKNKVLSITVPNSSPIEIPVKCSFSFRADSTAPKYMSQFATMSDEGKTLILYRDGTGLVYETGSRIILEAFPASLPMSIQNPTIKVLGYATVDKQSCILVHDTELKNLVFAVLPIVGLYVATFKVKKILPDVVFKGKPVVFDKVRDDISIYRVVKDIDWSDYVEQII